MLSVVLQPYHQVFSLPKDFILSSLSHSLFSEALQEDPSATEITIPNPDVTPDAMDVIVNSSLGLEPLHHNPNLILAYRYLNIPFLLYYVDPLYDQIPDRQVITDPRNRKVWEEAIKTDHDLIVGYYLVKGWVPTNVDFITAARIGATKVVRLLLGDARVNPADRNNLAIRWAAEQGHLEVVRLLLGDARVNPAAGNNMAIRWAASKGQEEVVRLLLGDARVNPADENNEAIIRAAENGHDAVVKLLETDPRVRDLL